MKLSDRLERASSLYGAGLVVVAAGGLSVAASAMVAFVVAASLQMALGWSSDQTSLAFWILLALALPLPLGAFLARRGRPDPIAAQDQPSL